MVGKWEILIILLVAFMVFGSKRLPDVARGLGRGLREFKREMQGITDELSKVTEDDDSSESERPVKSSSAVKASEKNAVSSPDPDTASKPEEASDTSSDNGAEKP